MKRYSRSYISILGVAVCTLWLAIATPAVRAQKANDAQILQDAQRQLKDKKYSGIHVQVQGGVVQLTGQVDRYADKADAEKRIDKMHEAASIRNGISVAGAGSVSDAGAISEVGQAARLRSPGISVVSVQQHHAAGT